VADLAEAFLKADSDMYLVHRRVVRVGAGAAWFAAAAFVLIGLIAGNSALVLQAIAPVLIGAFMTAQILAQGENAYVGLVAAAVGVVVFYAAIGNEDTIVPAGVSLVIICALAIVFVETRITQVISVVCVGLFVTPFLWGLSFGEAIGLGFGMSLCFVVASVIFVSVKSALAQLQTRFQMLFERSPTAVMEEDWSRAVSYLRSEYKGRPDRIHQFLLANPAVVRRAVAMANIVRVNEAAVSLFEARGQEDLLGPRNPLRVTGANVEAFVDALVTLYEGRDVFEEEVLAQTFSGKPIWLQVRAADTSPDRSGSRIIMGFADVTHIKERSEAMSRLVKSKDEFIARVSHELRTPLTAVVGLTSEMSSIGSMSAKERGELMGLVAGQAAEMSYIVEDLLVAARAEMGTVAIDPTTVDLDHELRTTIDGLGVGVDELPEGIRHVHADASRVRQILRNLLTNADRYGGPRRRVVAGNVDDRVWLEVRDDGEGVPAEMADQIFDPYTTAHAGISGSVGLGLSVARQLASMMGGSLIYRRDAGETVFRLELPMAEKMGHGALASKLSAH
jgi:signal transduction histidine kinase